MNVELDLRYVTPGGFVDFADIPYDANDPLIVAILKSNADGLRRFDPAVPTQRS